MVFSSIPFLFYFLPLALLLYFAAPVSLRNLVLLFVSLFFYAWGEPVYVFLMIASILFNYGAGRLIGSRIDQAETGKRRPKGIRLTPRVILICASAGNLLLLGFFKYADFLIDNLNGLLGLSLAPLSLPLPIGISFYTFQAMSYIIDLYRGKVGVQKSVINFGAYVSLFPQLIAGPIVRIASIEEELLSRRESIPLFAEGVRQFVCGMGKKVLLANNIGMIWNQISQMPPETLPAGTAWIGAFAFTFQIYFDFSGYSDMAIGLGKMLGFHFPVNFNYPYISQSITEFWRRWHISLSTWFKEYVYIPLGGNRRGPLLQIRNILIVWMLTGLWHGASWNFVVWGIYFGVLLILEKLFLGNALSRAPRAIRHIYTLFFVIVSWVIFAFDSMEQGFAYMKAMAGGYGAGLWDQQTLYLLYTNAALFVILIFGSTRFPQKLRTLWETRLSSLQGLSCAGEVIWFLGIFLLCLAYLVSSSYNPFLYFRFLEEAKP